MRERPILMNGDMVRAILAGTKTQTRRPAPIEALSFTHHPEGLITWAVQFMKAVKGVLASYSGGSFTEEVARSIIASQFCPYGQAGDRLWVRETMWVSECGRYYALYNLHRPYPDCDVFTRDGRRWKSESKIEGRCLSGAISMWSRCGNPKEITHAEFERGAFDVNFMDLDPSVPVKIGETKPLAEYHARFKRQIPSIHMPRWACRLVLEIVHVRVEQVKDISDDDARAEGFTDAMAFKDAWEAIYSKLGVAMWGWVWVVEFKPTEASA